MLLETIIFDHQNFVVRHTCVNELLCILHNPLPYRVIFFNRQIALTVILIRAGLGLDPKALRRLSFAVLRLAFSPCLAETVAIGVAAYLILDFPWPWGFMLG